MNGLILNTSTAKKLESDVMDKLQVESEDVDEIKEPNLITSAEVLKKTGISRAILNEYIKMGILPGLVVQKTGQDTQGINQVSYFPESVVWRIELVKKLTREGEPLEKIAKQFAGNSSTVELFPFSNDKKQLNSEEDVSIDIDETGDSESQNPTALSVENRRRPGARIYERKNDLKLTIADLDLPAYLVNHNFEVEWVNAKAEKMIFNAPVSSIENVESRNIFKLFFSFEFHSNLNNWKEIISYHMSYVRRRFDKHSLSKIYQGFSNPEIRFLEELYETAVDGIQIPFTNSPIHFERSDGTVEYFKIYSMRFREGLFFAYVPVDQEQSGILEFLSNRDVVINELLKHRMPALVSLCVLVADLQDSVRMSAELLPGEYFYLINDLWDSMAGCFEKFGGIYGKHTGDGMLYYFIKKAGTDYIMNSVGCALELRDKMKEFSSKWKIKKGWNEDLYLNIGINEGQEFFGTIRSAPTVEFTALGDSINYAGRLSDFARYGEIWTTRSVIGKMDSEKLKRIPIRY